MPKAGQVQWLLIEYIFSLIGSGVTVQSLNSLTSCNMATPHLETSSGTSSRDDVMEPGMLRCYHVIVCHLVGHGAVCVQMPDELQYSKSSCHRLY